MRRKKVDTDFERQLAAASILSDRFCREMLLMFNKHLVDNDYVRMVVEWSMAYHQKYTKAPGRDIHDLFRSHARNGLDEDTAEIIGAFLKSIEDDFDGPGINVDHLLDQVEVYFKERAIQALIEDMRADLVDNDVMSAESRIANFKRVGRPTSLGTNPFTDSDLIYTSFEENSEPLFRLPGALGDMLDRQLVRQGFIGTQAPEKRGKTFWLSELAFRAYRARRNVAYIAVGDMSETQMTKRHHVRTTRRPYISKDCGSFDIPCLDCRKNQDDSCRLDRRTCRVGVVEIDQTVEDPVQAYAERPRKYVPCTECEQDRPQDFDPTIWYERVRIDKPLTWRDGYKAGLKLGRALRGCQFKQIAVPTMTVAQIEQQIDMWKHFDNFQADVVVIDYADNLSAEDKRLEPRHQQNEIWKALRQTSLKYHNLIITATQTDASSPDVGTITRKHFSEDKRKYGHVTCMLALNQTVEEKTRGIMRVNVVLQREGDYNERETVTVLQALRIGQPMIGAFWTPRGYDPFYRKSKGEDEE